MALGTRQNIFYRALTATSSGASTTITVDRPFTVSRLKLGSTSAIGATKIRIQAEGELLYSGGDVPVTSLFLTTDDGAAGSAVQNSPRVLQFDRPLQLSKDYPMTITLSGSTVACDIVGEGI